MGIVHPSRYTRLFSSATMALTAGLASMALGTCGPFTDVAADAFCPFVLEIFTLGITTGTTATTYDPIANVTRLQMAAFLSRTVDGALRWGSWRAALDSQFVSVVRASTGAVLATVTAGGLIGSTFAAAFDGERVLVTNAGLDRVALFKAADLTDLGVFQTGASTGPYGACSDGINFWISFAFSGQLARF
jgi:hypothetical protein